LTIFYFSGDAGLTRYLFVFLILLSIYPVSFRSGGFSRSIILYAPAVSREGGGALLTINLTLKYPGIGRLYFSAEPLIELDTQATARIAAYVASRTAGFDYYSYDYYVVITSSSLVVGGPSAGALMTIGFISLFLNKTLNDTVSMTGMINPDGSIGPVGGLLDKLNAVAEKGYRVFLIPLGQRITYVEERVVEKYPWGYFETIRYKQVDLYEEGAGKGVTVIEVGNIFDAMKYFLNIEPTINAKTPKLPSRVENIVFNQLMSNIREINRLYAENQQLYRELDLFTQIQLSQRFNALNQLNNTLTQLINNNASLATLDYSYIVMRENTGFNWLAKYVRGRIGVENITRVINNTIDDVRSMINKTSGYNPYLVEAWKTYYLAVNNYINYIRSSGNTDPITFFYNLADVFTDLNITSYYINLAQQYPLTTINPDATLLTLISLSSAITSYAYSLTQDLGSSNNYINYGMDLLEKSYQAVRDNYTYAAIGLLIDNIVYMDIGIEKLFINDENVFNNITSYLEKQLQYTISIYQNTETVSYLYKLGNEYYLNNQSTYSAISYLKAILYLTTTTNETNHKPQYIEITPKIPSSTGGTCNVITDNREVITYFLIGLLIGVVITLPITIYLAIRKQTKTQTNLPNI